MLLGEVVETSRKVGETTKRLEKAGLLAELLRHSNPDEIEVVVAFLSGRARQGRIGVGYGALRDAASESSVHASLGLLEVDRIFQSIAGTKGSGSERDRFQILKELLGRATRPEQEFLQRLLLGEIRQGALEGLMVDALSKAFDVPVARVRRAVMLEGDITPIARILRERGEAGLDGHDVRLFRPVQPMLAQSAEDVSEAMNSLDEAALEYKLDGARVQVHRGGDQVVVFSRALNDVTAAVPEIVEAVRALPERELILDGEILALGAGGRPLPFQTTMRRFGRKLNVERMRSDLPLSPFWFDLMYVNGASLLDEPQSERFRSLKSLAPSEFVIPHTVAQNLLHATEFLEQALLQGHEGIMAKALNAGYAAGGRGQSWLKIKQARTLDLVILAAEWGSGRRQGWLSNLHLGARDTEKGGFAMLGKTFKGLTDEMLRWQTQELLRIEIGRDGNTVYVEPKLVAEIAFNEIQVSSRYVSGLALRFARVKQYRLDKNAADSDTFQTVQDWAGAALR